MATRRDPSQPRVGLDGGEPHTPDVEAPVDGDTLAAGPTSVPYDLTQLGERVTISTGRTTSSDGVSALAMSSPGAAGWGPKDETVALDTQTGTGRAEGARPTQFAFAGRVLFAPANGDRFGEGGRFELLEEIGSGGMGKVFRAHDRQLDRSVAVKFIFKGSSLRVDELAALLRQEAKATARLSHDNIVAIFDIGTWNEVPYLVMEHLVGETLDSVLQRQRLKPQQATEIFTGIARGLDHAHRNGLIHRDLKPANVFITTDGRAKILDFGLASFDRTRLRGGDAEGDAGQNGEPTAPPLLAAGTPAYMAPEQWKGAPQDVRTDVWAAGVMFFEMLTGVQPFTGDISALLSSAPAPPVRLHEPDAPDEAEAICGRAMAKDPAQRYQTVGELLEALAVLDRGFRRTGPTSAGRRGPQRRQVTIFASSLLGTGALSDDDLEEHTDVLRTFHDACNAAIAEQGGAVIVSMGGKFVGCFGYPVMHEDDAQRAVRAGLHLAEALAKLPCRDVSPVDAHIGIHTGLAVVDDTQGQPGVPQIQSNAPNVAAAVGERGAPNTVVLSQATYGLVRGLFTVEPIVALSGGAAGHGAARAPAGEAYRVTGEAGVESRFERSFGSELTPFVGRDHVVDQLSAAWSEAQQSRGQVVLIGGEAGIGKSRLCQALKDRVSEQGRRATAQCWPHCRNSAFYPLIDLFQRLAGITREHSAEEKLDRIEAFIKGLAVDAAVVVPTVATLLSVPFTDRYPPISIPPPQLRKRTLESLASVVIALGIDTPLLLTVEDIHWGDHSTLELLSILVDVLRSSRVLLVLTFRPEFKPLWNDRADRAWMHRIDVGRLPPEVAAAMVEKAACGRRLPPELVAELCAKTDGVPLFVEEMTRAVLEAAGDRGAPVLSTSTIPATLHELLLARLDRLPLAAREVAQAGAVIGREFSYSLLRQVVSHDEPTLQRGLVRLAQAGLLQSEGEPPEARYQWKHALVQEAAYQVLVKKVRQQAHEKVARILASQFPDLVETQPELLAHHLAEAGDVAQAVEYRDRAAQRAVQRSANIEAVNHFRKALQLLHSQPEDGARDRRELSILLALGSPLMAVKGYASPEVRESYDRARELCLRAEHREQLFPSTLGVWQYSMVAGDLVKARQLSEQLVAIADASNDAAFTILATRAHGTTIMLQGEVAAGRAQCEKGLRLYDQATHGALAYKTGHDPGVVNGLYASWSAWLLGDPDEALRLVHEARDRARALRHPVSLAFSLTFSAMIHQYRGELEAARSEAAEGVGIARAHNLALWLAWGTIQHGSALAALGAACDGTAGIEVLRQGVAAWRKTGARAGLTCFLVGLAEACLREGRLDEAEAELRSAAELRTMNDEHFYEPERIRLDVRVMLARDPSRRSEAEDRLLQALQLARSMKERSFELRIATSLAEVVGDGRATEGRARIAEVLSRFTEGFGTADLAHARALAG